MVELLLLANIITWDAPTTREDGSELLPEEICGYNIIIDGGSVNAGLTVPATPTEHDVSYLDNGSHVWTIATIDCDGRQSVMSEEHQFQKKGKPNPPSNLQHEYRK